MADDSTSLFRETLDRYEIRLPSEVIDQLDDYRRLLWEWNERLNLTRHTDYEKFVTRDIVDSLQLMELLEPDEEILDMGTGGGVPGIVLAIVRPDLQVSLVESVAKRATAVDKIVKVLGLPIPMHHERAEKHLDDFRYDTIVARAVAPLHKLLTWLGPQRIMFGRLLAIKGTKWLEERNEARHMGLMHQFDLRRVATYQTPGKESENVILQISAKRE